MSQGFTTPSASLPLAAHQFTILWPEEQQASVPPGRRHDPPRSDPRLEWTVDDFVERWYVPGILKPKRRASGTLDNYDDSLRYWRAVTSDMIDQDGERKFGPAGPTMFDIFSDDQIGIDFVGLLQEWGYSRLGVRRGGKCRIGRIDHFPSFTQLKSPTVAGHASRIATILSYAGPRFNARRPAAEILPRLPFIPPMSAEFETKPPFDLATARQIADACVAMTKPDLPPGWDVVQWWKTRLALFFYTGLRAGTVTRLARKHLHETGGLLSLKVPGAIVKTGKAVELPLHPQLAALVRQLPPGGPEDLLLPAGCGYRHFLTLHSELQELSGVPLELRQSPHAWRRTHLVQMGQLGANDALRIAQLAADHADARTTRDHYVGQALVNQLRLQLPLLFC